MKEKRIIEIALPIIFQNLLVSSFSIVDLIMVGSLGETAISAIGISNQVFLIINVLLGSLSSGISIFIVQHWGSKNLFNIKKNIILLLVLNSCISIFLYFIVMLFSNNIYSIFSNDYNVIKSGEIYLRIIINGYFFSIFTFTFASALKSIEKPHISLVISIVALLINTSLNYVLIFGKFNFPAMGIRGAAIATFISKIIEGLLFLVIATRIFKLHKIKKHMLLIALRIKSIKKILKVTIPLILNGLSWVAGITVYNAFYSRIGTNEFAALNICLSVQSFAFIVFIGLSQATAVILGKNLGRNQFSSVVKIAKKMIYSTLLFGILTGILLPLFNYFVPLLFNLESETVIVTYSILFAMGILFPIKIMNMLLNQGVLASGGDTKYSLFISLISMWVIGVPVIIISIAIFKLPIYWVILITGLEEVVKFIMLFKRYRSKRWLKNIVK